MSQRTFAISLFAAEFLVRLILLPAIIMSAGINIAGAFGFSIYPSTNLLVATASIVGVPWLTKATLHLIGDIGAAYFQNQAYNQYAEELQRLKIQELTGTGDNPSREDISIEDKKLKYNGPTSVDQRTDDETI